MFKKIILVIIILIIVFLIVYFFFINKKFSNKISMPEEKKLNLRGKKVALIIAQEGFEDNEFSQTKDVLIRQGAEISVVSKNTVLPALGKYGLEVIPDIKLDDLEVEDFNAIVFIGGPGATVYVDDLRAHQIIKEAVEKKKILGAICIAPTILAKAGVLRGVEATVWSNAFDPSTIDVLKESGANYIDKPVVISGKIVTANGPSAASEFGEALASLLGEE